MRERVHINSYAFMYSSLQQCGGGISGLPGPNISGQVEHVFPSFEVYRHKHYVHTYIHT